LKKKKLYKVAKGKLEEEIEGENQSGKMKSFSSGVRKIGMNLNFPTYKGRDHCRVLLRIHFPGCIKIVTVQE
jgi:hypothetical protein